MEIKGKNNKKEKITLSGNNLKMAFLPKIEIFLVYFLYFLAFGSSLEKDMTTIVEPGSEECFYQTLKEGDTLEIEYQVIDGGQGELDISFHLTSPSGRLHIMDYKKPDNVHREKISEAGDYRLCFDNKFSSFNSKTVFFELSITAAGEENPWDDEFDSEELTPEEVYEMKIQDIKDAVYRVKNQIALIIDAQYMFRVIESKDRHVAESNYTRVNTWSVIQIFLMIVVGIIQVVMVKSLFDEKSRFHKVWREGISSVWS